MALLFGNSSRSSSTTNNPKNQVEFRAGKMSLKGSTVSPDKRKGLVYIYQAEDGLTHFCWKDRKSGAVEDDLILFPDDCEYKRVTQAKEGSRVYLLKFKSSTRKLFFWMQEPKEERDEELVTKVNDALNNPGKGGGAGAGGSGAGGLLSGTSSEQDMQSLLSSMSHAQLMQLIGGMSELGGGGGLLAHLGGMAGSNNSTGSSATTAATPTTPTTTKTEPSSGAAAAARPPEPKASTKTKTDPEGKQGAIKLDDLQKILSGLPGQGQQQQGAAAAEAVDLSAAVSSDLISRITSCPATVKKLAPLLPQFGGPEVDAAEVDAAEVDADAAGPDAAAAGASIDSGEEASQVADTLTSPQFHSALRAFCAAFPTGQLGPLVSQFGMGAAAVEAAEKGDLESFINAIQQEGGKVKEEPEEMNLD